MSENTIRLLFDNMIETQHKGLDNPGHGYPCYRHPGRAQGSMLTFGTRVGIEILRLSVHGAHLKIKSEQIVKVGAHLHMALLVSYIRTTCTDRLLFTMENIALLPVLVTT